MAPAAYIAESEKRREALERIISDPSSAASIADAALRGKTEDYK